MDEIYQKTCCFTGHRKLSKTERIKLKFKIKKAVISLISTGYQYFGVGGALGFDTLAEKVIIKLKKHYPQIRLILVIPFPFQSERWSRKDKKTYEKIKASADKTVCISERYTDNCYQLRNRHLIDCSSICICYLKNKKSGTQSTVNYAHQKGLKVINLAT